MIVSHQLRAKKEKERLMQADCQSSYHWHNKPTRQILIEKERIAFLSSLDLEICHFFFSLVSVFATREAQSILIVTSQQEEIN